MDNVHHRNLEETHTGEEEQREDKIKPVLKKVKEKVKKIKNTLGKTTKNTEEKEEEEHGLGFEEDDDEEPQVLDPQVPCQPLEEAMDSKKSSRDEEDEPGKEAIGLAQIKGGLQEDPSLPPLNGDSSQAAGAKAHPPPSGVEEAGMSPTLESFKAMKISGEEEKDEEKAGKGGSASYTQKMNSAVVVAKDAAARGAEVAKDAAARGVEYGMAAKDAAARGVECGMRSDVYGKIAEKLRPGEDDRALSEVISETIRGKISSGEKREAGGGDEAMKEETPLPPPPSDGDTDEGDKEKESPPPGMMQKIKGTVTSWFGSTVGAGAAQESLSEVTLEGEKKSG